MRVLSRTIELPRRLVSAIFRSSARCGAGLRQRPYRGARFRKPLCEFSPVCEVVGNKSHAILLHAVEEIAGVFRGRGRSDQEISRYLRGYQAEPNCNAWKHGALLSRATQDVALSSRNFPA
jgi:hypothetical protein